MLGKYSPEPVNHPMPLASELSPMAYFQGLPMRLNTESHTAHYRARVTDQDFENLFFLNCAGQTQAAAAGGYKKAKNEHSAKFAGITWTRNRQRGQWIVTVNASDAQKLNALDLLTFEPDKRFEQISDPMTLNVC